MRRHTIIFILVAGAIAGCSPGDRTASPQIPNLIDLKRDVTTNIAAIDPNRAAVMTADELREAFESLLAVHVETLDEVMQRARNREPSLAQWTTKLTKNTDDITGAIGLMYGPVGARSFGQQWAHHTQFLMNYADALSRDDRDGMQLARENLHDYEHDNAALLDTATAGNAPQAAVEAMLTTHVRQMIDALNSSPNHNEQTHSASVATARKYAQLIGATLAAAVAAQQPQAFPTSK